MGTDADARVRDPHRPWPPDWSMSSRDFRFARLAREDRPTRHAGRARWRPTISTGVRRCVPGPGRGPRQYLASAVDHITTQMPSVACTTVIIHATISPRSRNSRRVQPGQLRGHDGRRRRRRLGNPDLLWGEINNLVLQTPPRHSARGMSTPRSATRWRKTLSEAEERSYDTVKDELSLAARITSDCRAVSNDRHLEVHVAPAESRGEAGHLGPSIDEMRAEEHAFGRSRSFPATSLEARRLRGYR